MADTPSGLRSQVSGHGDSSRLLEHFRASKRRVPLHPLEKAVLAAVAVHLCFLPWALGTMHPWSQITSLALATIGLFLALIPRIYDGDLNPGIHIGETNHPSLSSAASAKGEAISPQPSRGSAFRLNPWPRLLRFPIFWLGLALLGYIALQASNPSWVWTRNATSWWLVRVNDIEWLPTSIDTPFERFNIWRQFIIYASAWLTMCTMWVGFTRLHSLRLLLALLVGNAAILALIGFAQRVASPAKYLGWYEWPPGNTAFASFIYRNHAGAYFALATFIAVALAIRFVSRGERAGEKSSPAGVLFLAGALLTAAVIFSLSRGATLILLGTWLIAALWFFVGRRRAESPSTMHPGVQAALALMFLAIAAFAAREVDFSAVQDRFQSLAKNHANLRNESVQWRVQAYDAADEMLADYWLRGTGAGGFRYLFPEYIKKHPEVYADGWLFWEHAHSDFREIPIELGLAGTALLVLGAGQWLMSLFRSGLFRHALVFPLLLGCSQTVLHAWFDFPFQNPAILVTWLALAVLAQRWIELNPTEPL